MLSDNFITNQLCDDALRRLANGDMDALTVIYRRLGRQIFTLSLSIVRETHTAEDVMQDTFVKLAAQAHTYNPGSNAVAFVLTVTRNLSLNILRRRKYETTVEIDEKDEIPDTDDRRLPALETLSLLDETERQIVVLKLDGKLKFKRIGELLGISAEACRKRYRRALDKLKEYYI